MQSVNAAFTAEEKDSVRSIAQNTQISWHKQSTLGNRTFTIGTSTIGGNDIIGITPGAIGSPANYKYFNESAYVLGLSWERGYSMPLGGLTKAMAEIQLDNTSSRFTPRYMGGNSELYTAQPLRSPVILNAGFNLGADINLPQFAGVITEQPELSTRNKTYSIKASDYIDYFENKYLDHAVMYTGINTSSVLTNLSTLMGMNTAQYDYDTGINVLPFAFFDVGTKFSDAFNQLTEAENGRFYQDESGIFKFENRYHWQNSPYTQVQKVITTAMVIDAQSPNLDHLVNVVEVRGKQYVKQPLQILINYSLATLINANSTVELFFNYTDPVLQITAPTNGGTDSYYIANTQSDGNGTDSTSSVSVKSISNFSQASKIVFQNNSSSNLYLTSVVISGRSAKNIQDIYIRSQDDSSVTAYQERLQSIDNNFINDPTWAASLARMLLDDYSSPENLQRITIRAIPELQLGDLISWQGRYWRIFDIKSTLDANSGFIQELLLLQRQIVSYFRIGVSTIGGSDKIAP